LELVAFTFGVVSLASIWRPAAFFGPLRSRVAGRGLRLSGRRVAASVCQTRFVSGWPGGVDIPARAIGISGYCIRPVWPDSRSSPNTGWLAAAAGGDMRQDFQ
jgi:hypothetical protein